MSFWKKLKTVLTYVSQDAVIASAAKGTPVGMALDTVNLIMAQKGNTQQQGVIDSTKALAVAVDDHEGNIKALQQAIAMMAGAAIRGDTTTLQSIAQSFSGTPHMGEPLPPPPPSPNVSSPFTGPPAKSTRQSDK